MAGNATYFPRTPIWLCATGARTPVGLDAPSTAAAVRAGISALAEHPVFVDQDGEPMRLACDALLAPDAPIGDRLAALASAALDELPAALSSGTLLLVCSPEPRPGLPIDAAEALGRFLSGRLRRAGLRVQLLPQGHAAGLVAFGVAARALDEGTTDAAVVLGVDSYHDPDTLEWMDTSGQLKSETNRDGFFPGEAAGACLLAREDRSAALGLRPLARLAAVSTAVEPVTIRSEEAVCTGEGLSAAFLGLAPTIENGGPRITDTWCDMNGQRYRSEELLYTLLRAQHLSEDAHAYEHPADCWGDVGAASGPLLALLAIAARHKAYAHGPRAALWASSEGGRRAVALLDVPEPMVAA
jgi:3-oxoacyl-[acyl-carrier-protein] synthase-1